MGNLESESDATSIKSILESLPLSDANDEECSANWAKLAVTALHDRDFVRAFVVEDAFLSILARSARLLKKGSNVHTGMGQSSIHHGGTETPRRA